jgi:hypothetical protein
MAAWLRRNIVKVPFLFSASRATWAASWGAMLARLGPAANGGFFNHDGQALPW